MKQFVALAVMGLVTFGVVYAVTKHYRQQPNVTVPPVVGVGEGHGKSIPGAPPGMVLIPGGDFTMGTDSELAWPDEKPAHRVRVDGFWIDSGEVTNDEFRAFVTATGYRTTAEKQVDVDEILRQSPPGTPRPPDESLVPGSLVFAMTEGPIKQDDVSQWWTWTPGANWQHPEGPQSDLRVVRRDRVCEVGGEAIANRSGMGVGRSGWIEGQNLRLGR
jgi:sulfatase modifying factor 1